MPIRHKRKVRQSRDVMVTRAKKQQFIMLGKTPPQIASARNSQTLFPSTSHRVLYPNAALHDRGFRLGASISTFIQKTASNRKDKGTGVGQENRPSVENSINVLDSSSADGGDGQMSSTDQHQRLMQRLSISQNTSNIDENTHNISVMNIN